MSEREILRLSDIFNKLQKELNKVKRDLRRLNTGNSQIAAQSGGSASSHGSISGVTANQHHSENHTARHAPGGNDELILDEDDLATESDTKAATQGNVKAYVDAQDHDHSTPIAAAVGGEVTQHSDVSDAGSGAIITAGERTKLSGIETAATADQSDSEIATAYNNEVDAASQAEMEAGTETAIRRMSPLRVAEAIAALSLGVSGAVDAIEEVGTSTSEEADDYLIIVVDGVAKRVLCSHIDEDVLTAIKSYVDNSVSTYGDSDAVDAVEAVSETTPEATDYLVYIDGGELKKIQLSSIDEDMLTAIKSYVDANSGGDPVASYPDLDTGAYGGSETHDTTAEGTGGFGLWINPDGTKLYVCATGSNEVNEYDLSPPYSIASMSHSDDFSVNSQAPDARSMCFNRDGTKMYIGDQDDANVHQYSLTAWDLTTASYETKVLDTSSEVSDLRSIEISEDGTKFYAKTQAGTVYQYTLNTPYDLSTGSYASKSFNTAQDGNAIRWSSDGMRMYVSDLTNDEVEEFRATTAWDVSTLEATGAVLTVSGQVTSHTGMCINIDGRYVYVIDNAGDDMYRYDCQHYHKTPEE